MKCDSCEEKATVFYTQIADGKLKKFVLCESCAQEKGITDPNGLLMAEQVLDHTLSVPDAEVISLESSGECTTCGFGIGNYQKVGRLGCPDCYDVFAKEIGERIPTMHKNSTHRGYSPVGLMATQAREAKLIDLNARLSKAIESENYEEAAKLRDELESLNLSKTEEATAESES
ncbi:UvrB/UvrC motif-containing protein [Akkermansiaceae bacterium]|nr:UvrB/UvrC motif-containing protein [Akkermansiaceae bacterium]